MNKLLKPFFNKKTRLYGIVVGGLAASITVPVLSAIIVQNFTQIAGTVETNPIERLAGADANVSQYLTVDLGQTISNQDDTDTTAGTSPTLLSNEQITFACFEGSRTYYQDVIQLQNTTGSENWAVNLRIEQDVAGNASTSQTFTDTNADGGDADIYLFASEIDSTTPVTSLPSPTSYNSLTEWYDEDAGDAGISALKLEVTNSVLSIVDAETTAFTIPGGEQRQIAIVVDCGSNMADEIGPGNTGTFRFTVEAVKV